MNVQVTIKIDRESIAELAEVFRGIPGAAPSGQTVPQTRQPVPVTPSQAQPAPQGQQAYSAQIAQKTQLPPEAVTGGAATAQTAVPTAPHTYTLDELANAAMQLMGRGMQVQLQELLAGYGVEALPMLPAEQYGNFATALRGMGAQI